MKHHSTLPGLPARLAAFVILSAFGSAQASAEISYNLQAVPADAPEIQFGQPRSAAASTVGEVFLADGSTLATIQAGWDAEHLYIKVSVNDAEHVAAPDARRLWSADSIEVGIDAAGDRSTTLPEATRNPITQDDFKLIFGRIDSEPVGYVLAARDKPDIAPVMAGTTIQRPSDAVTEYKLVIPWSWLHVEAGARPTLGLDIQINDRDAGQKDKTAYRWGDGLAKGYQAAYLNTFRFAGAPEGFAALQWGDPLSWDASTPNTLHLGIKADTPQTLHLTIGDTQKTVTVPATDGLQSFTLATPVASHGAPLRASLGDEASAEATQTVAAQIHQDLQDRLAELMAAPDAHPLFLRHLQSIADLSADDWARTQRTRQKNPQHAMESLDHYRDLLYGLNADSGDWEAYLDGRRSMVLAYTSDFDGSLQYYLFSLPKDWDPEKAYPLFFELHGHGNDHPMGSFSNRLASTPKVQDAAGYEAPKTYAEIERSGYWVHPFGRGNLGYEGVSQTDLLEAYAHVHSLFKIDPNRRYLYGYSMGGRGVYTFGARTPSRWAAAQSIAPAFVKGYYGIPLDHPVTANWALLPYRIVTGEEDRFITSYHTLHEVLGEFGIEPEGRSVPGLGHNYTHELQVEKIKWLKSHVRQRPDAFEFVADAPPLNTCWGITLHMPKDSEKVARVQYQRDGQTIYLQTEGTDHITIDPSEADGLGLSGNIEVFWNEKLAYQGPAKVLELR